MDFFSELFASEAEDAAAKKLSDQINVENFVSQAKDTGILTVRPDCKNPKPLADYYMFLHTFLVNVGLIESKFDFLAFFTADKTYKKTALLATITQPEFDKLFVDKANDSNLKMITDCCVIDQVKLLDYTKNFSNDPTKRYDGFKMIQKQETAAPPRQGAGSRKKRGRKPRSRRRKHP
jgi:hypothetical protein